MKILIIEDDTGLRILQQEIFEEIGYEVILSDCGKTAVEMIKNEKPDFLILDYSLPDMDGCEFIHFLSSLNMPAPPFIVATGQGDEKIAVKMMKLGARDYVVKDSNFLDLLPELVKRIILDIENEEKRKRAEALHRELFDSIGMELYYIDIDYNFKMVNKKIQQNFEQEEEFFIGKKCYDIFNDKKQSVCSHCPVAVTFNNNAPNEDKIVRKNGKQEIYLVKSFPVKYKENAAVGGAIVLRENITEKVNLENELNHSRKLESLGQLVGGIAHDFNNMLTGIMGAVNVIQHKKDITPDIQRIMDLIMKTSVRAADLTGKLLFFSRKSEKKMELVSSRELVEESICLLERSISKNIVIHKDFQEEKGIISGDSAQLLNVLINLGINAVHAMPNGGELFFSTKKRMLTNSEINMLSDEISQGEYIEIQVKDTGCGISQDNISKIFDPFFTTKGEGKGTGLGLSTVYGIVRDHRGIVTVDSQEEKGTVFTILLPLSHREEQVANQSGGMKKGKGTILFVDDEDVIRTTMEEILKYYGYTVFLAKNGKEAIEIFIENKEIIDLIIMDMVMPIMDGKEAFLKIREIDENIEVIITSGYTEEKKLEEMYESGNFTFIRKPFKNEDLSHVLAEKLK